MRAEQTVSEMVVESLARRAEVLLEGSGKTFEEAFAEVLETPAGRRMRQAHMHFVRFRDGLAVEQWGVRDDLGMMQQLGVPPEPGQAGEAGTP
jgi:predicted ester cyclase